MTSRVRIVAVMVFCVFALILLVRKSVNHGKVPIISPDSSGNTNAHVLVVYTFYTRIKDDNNCRSNFFFFLKHGVRASPEVDFKFLILEDSYVPPLLVEVAKLPNVEVVFRKNYSSDLCGYHHYLSGLDLAQYQYFFLMNCGARGPYTRPDRGPLSYVDRYISLFQHNVGLAGASISCEQDVHVQTWFVVLNKVSLNVALSLWKECPSNWLKVVTTGEVGLSVRIRKMGYRMASLVPEFNPYFNGRCSFKKNPAYKEQKLFQQMFVKHGGEMARDHLLSYKTMIQVAKHEGTLGKESGRSDEEEVRHLIEHVINRPCADARLLYLKRNPGVRIARVDPWEHFLNFGKKEGRRWPGKKC